MRWYGEGTVKSVDSVPNYLQREYIVDGYRVGGGYLSAMRSLFELHNETMNAWTMVWISTASTVCLWDVWRNMGTIPAPFWMIWLSVLLHFPFSLGLHLFIGISEDVRKTWRTLDVFFIQFCSVLLAGALGYYVCQQYYSVFMSVTLAAFVRNVYSTMVRRRIWNIPKPELAKQVAVMVFMYGTPVLIQGFLDFYNGLYFDGAIPYLVVLTIVLEVGRRTYSKHVPEKWAPGQFDYFFNSHQIMHVMALLAHLLEWAFVHHMYKRYHQVQPLLELP